MCVLPALLAAQAPADAHDAVARLEQERIDAIRAGRSLARFYAPDYRGVNTLGQYETLDRVESPAADPEYAHVCDVAIDVHDDTAVVTGVEGESDATRERVLRVWTRRNGVWTIAAAHATWIGSRSGAPAAAGPLPESAVNTFTPRTIAEESVWLSQDALMHAFADADPETYKLFSTDASLRMTTNGDAIARPQWLDTIAKRKKGPLAIVDEVRIATFGDVAVVTLRGHEAMPTRQSWVYLRTGGLWKLQLRFTTVIRGT